MKKGSMTGSLNYILFRLLGFFIRALPKQFSFFLGRRLGELLFYFNPKRKSLVYSNIKTALGDELRPCELNNLTREFYRGLGQNITEIFFIPLIDKKYMNKYITFECLQYIEEAFKKGKGVILLSIHSGSWELSNIICANLGFTFNLFVREQRNLYLNELVNFYRQHKGCKIIQRENQLKYLIEALKRNEAIGMTADQGGKSGILVKFFGREASMATGAVRLGLKYDAVILPVFYTRVKGPYIKTIFGPPIELKRSENPEKDVYDNLQNIVRIFEKNIKAHPKDYLWSYKIWKYGKFRQILVISDGKTGHLRQAQAAASMVSNLFKEREIVPNIFTVEIKSRNTFAKKALAFSSFLAGKYRCQGCLWCLRRFLQKDAYKSLIAIKPDIIISCGSGVAPINYILSQENLAKSIVIMRPSILNVSRFNLVIMPKHDNPPKRKNVVETAGALNLIDEKYLKECISQSAERISPDNVQRSALSAQQLYIGLLIGGDTKNFNLKKDVISEVIKQIQSGAKKINAGILVTTSRRTPAKLEELVKEELKTTPQCKFLVIANENNIPEAIGGILGLSNIVVTSPESISMISEAASSGKYILVFRTQGLNKRHRRFLDYLARDKYIYLTEPSDLSKKMEEIWLNKPPIYTLRDNFLVREAIKGGFLTG